MSEGRRWNAASKDSRYKHSQRYPRCPIPDWEADRIAAARRAGPRTMRERKKQRDRERMAAKRREGKANSKPDVADANLMKAGKAKRATPNGDFLQRAI